MVELTTQNDTYIVRPKDVERNDLSLTLSFSKDLLESYLGIYDLACFDALSAQLTIRLWRGDGLFVDGTLQAECAQKCVVSLAPVPQHISADLAQGFIPAVKAIPGLEIEIDIEENLPDEFENGELDLAQFILEHFALELDLYPRAEDAIIDEAYHPPSDTEKKQEKPSPFAVLKDLKKPN